MELIKNGGYILLGAFIVLVIMYMILYFISKKEKRELDFYRMKAEGEYIDTPLSVLEYIAELEVIVKSRPEEPIEFAEWLSENKWKKTLLTFSDYSEKYWSDIHCKHKTIRELYADFQKVNKPDNSDWDSLDTSS